MQAEEALRQGYKELRGYRKDLERIGQRKQDEIKRLVRLKREMEEGEQRIADLAAEREAMDLKIENKLKEIDDIIGINFTAPE